MPNRGWSRRSQICWTGISATRPRNWPTWSINWRKRATRSGTAVGSPRSSHSWQESERLNSSWRWGRWCLARGWMRSRRTWTDSWRDSERDVRSGRGRALFPRGEDPLHPHLHHQVRVLEERFDRLSPPFIPDRFQGCRGRQADEPVLVLQLLDQGVNGLGVLDPPERDDRLLPDIFVLVFQGGQELLHRRLAELHKGLGRVL